MPMLQLVGVEVVEELHSSIEGGDYFIMSSELGRQIVQLYNFKYQHKIFVLFLTQQYKC